MNLLNKSGASTGDFNNQKHIIMLKKTISFAACAFIALASCNSIDPIEDGSETDDIKSTVTDNYDYYAENLGMAVHKAIADSPQARQLIKDEVMKKFDGDYDLLLSNAVSIQLDGDAMTRSAGTVTFGQLLESYIEAEPLTRSSESFLDELMEKYPDMQISVPVHADEWDPQTYTPDVAIIPSDYVEFETETLPAIDAQGNDIEIDAINEPDVPVIVVSRSERLGGGFIEGGVIGGSVVEMKPVVSIKGLYSNGTIKITYDVMGISDDRITELRLMRTSANSSDYSPIAILDKTKTQYIDRTVYSNKEYTYYIRLTYTKKDNNADQSDSKELFMMTDSKVPNPVSDFCVEPLSNNRNCLTWTNNSGEDYRTYIFRTTGSESDKLIATLDFDEDKFFDENVKPGEKWTYTIKKYNPNTDRFSPSTSAYIYNPYRDPEHPSNVILKKIGVDVDKVEAWSYGAPEFYITVVGIHENGESEQVADPIHVCFNEHTDYSQPLNALLYKWMYFSDERFYPTLNFHMIEYDGRAQVNEMTFGISVGIKFLKFIDVSLGANFTVKYGHNGCNCGSSYILYYENPEKVVTLPNYDSRLYLSDKDSNN